VRTASKNVASGNIPGAKVGHYFGKKDSYSRSTFHSCMMCLQKHGFKPRKDIYTERNKSTKLGLIFLGDIYEEVKKNDSSILFSTIQETD